MVRRCWVNFQCRGVLLTWLTVGQGPIVLAVGVGGGCLDIFSRVYHFSFLSPSLWETARYRLKYCRKGPLSPKQPTNQHLFVTRTAEINEVTRIFSRCLPKAGFTFFIMHWTITIAPPCQVSSRRLYFAHIFTITRQLAMCKNYVASWNHVIVCSYVIGLKVTRE